MSNKYTYSVPFTEEELYEDYVNQVITQAEIARKYGVSQKVVWRALHKMGIPTRKAYKLISLLCQANCYRLMEQESRQ